MNQKKVGEFIAQLRKEQNMTQEVLGEKLGVTNKTVSRWENGNYMPDVSVLAELCSILGVSVNELISGKRLTADEFQKTADDNLLNSIAQLKEFCHRKKMPNGLSGAGVGLLLGAAMSTPDTTRDYICIAIALVLIFISWYQRAKYDKLVSSIIGEAESSS